MTSTISINKEHFRIIDEAKREISYGCNQVWYHGYWQCRAGCGPTTATNLYIYLSQKSPEFLSTRNSMRSKADSLALMEEIWHYVKPSFRGVNTLRMFYEPFARYLKKKGLAASYQYFEVKPDYKSSEILAGMLLFIKEALEQDVPLAFLNLCNGEEQNLDRWHWVTIIGLEFSEDNDQVFVTFLDEGVTKTINLALWYHTTSLGGGLVCFRNL